MLKHLQKVGFSHLEHLFLLEALQQHEHLYQKIHVKATFSSVEKRKLTIYDIS